MQEPRLDHLVTYTNAPSLDALLDDYRRAGFSPRPLTQVHDPGLRNGFIPIGQEYLEICWVEDHEAFTKGDPQGYELTEDPRVCGMGLVCQDARVLHDEWVARGLSLPPYWSRRAVELGAGAEPTWTFQEIPGALSPGASCFVLSYHRPRAAQPEVGANTLCAIEGVSCVSSSPAQRAVAWQRMFAPGSDPVVRGEVHVVQVGPHFIQWMPAEVYHHRFESIWKPARHSIGEIAVVHVLARELSVARRCLEAAGRQVLARRDERGGQELLALPDPRDGLFLCIREQR